MTKAIFVHRSVGHNLIEDGGMYSLSKNHGYELNDYDHNSYELSDGKSTKKLNIVFEGDDTHPEHYAKLFSEDGRKSQKEALDLILDSDVIMIKSCYPNSHIKTDDELEAIKENYRSIAHFFEAMPDKKLIILTSPPLLPLRTNQKAACRARKLATWLSETKLGANTSVFNFFDLLAEPESSRKPNVLRKKYRRLLPVDSHPNPQASKEIAPLLVAFIKERIQAK